MPRSHAHVHTRLTFNTTNRQHIVRDTAYDDDGDRVLVEREARLGTVGPIARISLETPTACVRYLVSDGRGNTIGVACPIKLQAVGREMQA